MEGLDVKDKNRVRKAAQSRLLDLAGVYRNLSRRELARALGRDSSKLVSANGNPKLDYVVRLARLLDWPVGEVAEVICGEAMDLDAAPAGAAFDELDAAAKEAHRLGDFARMGQIARSMAAVADTPDRRALAALRESGAWDGLGRYSSQLEAIRRGLQQGPASSDLRLLLHANLANAYYTLSHLIEARSMARELLESLETSPPATRSARAAQAFALYVLGHASRSMMACESDRAGAHAQAAREALGRSHDHYIALAEEFGHDPWRGIANTCRGGIIEAEVELGLQSPDAALLSIVEHVAGVDPAASALVGDRLESCGWWCVFGGNIALRHLDGADLQRQMAALTGKGFAIADALDNWAMREKLFMLELAQRQRLNDLAGVPVEWTIDDDELRVIVGTMGRLPSFRRAGWHILETTTVVRSN